MGTRPGDDRGDRAWYQPRPALGLRPWFAFLRRARSLRRFAFAMAARVTKGGPYRELTLAVGNWRSVPVTLAATFGQRLVGVHGPGAVLMRTRSVHGVGLIGPIGVVHVTAAGIVAGHDVLLVDGRVRSTAHWVLELPLETGLPPVGVRLTVLPSSLR